MIGDIIFQLVSGNDLYWLLAFPLLMIAFLLFHVYVITLPIERFKFSIKKWRDIAFYEIFITMLFLGGYVATIVLSL